MKNTDKVTLTFGQIKRLLKEANSGKYEYIITDTDDFEKNSPISRSGEWNGIFDSVMEAFLKGVEWLYIRGYRNDAKYLFVVPEESKSKPNTNKPVLKAEFDKNERSLKLIYPKTM